MRGEDVGVAEGAGELVGVALGEGAEVCVRVKGEGAPLSVGGGVARAVEVGRGEPLEGGEAVDEGVEEGQAEAEAELLVLPRPQGSGCRVAGPYSASQRASQA